ncbi:prepilin-type N-terminal cleavage/methylation domain-containing protein [Deinococcus sp. KSM4-11]|uniref:prepilin-type N-terminal cleavage/methylation domain-containing protein n=1 Tax=Deinococcus sp. KSM4-11 TaxID=2568654 RepID=UPI0010A4309B|nr:prepilin-type N-terminal cleavage/methylation domain-containing protein [Deinococcus sp. KSM4-11]THF86026.1 prepilin-type N-terminal cleavage/methylation domain-containing protein [Deinococcus sp. KSM4-11]
MTTRSHVRGLTLVEVLVAIAILAIVIALSAAIITSLTTNSHSRTRLGVNQAAQQYIEVMTRDWLDPHRFGTVSASSPRPATLGGYTWEVTACEVTVPTDTAATSAFPCAAPPQTVTFTESTAAAATLTPSPAANFMRLTVTYSPTGSGQPLTTSTEFSRR